MRTNATILILIFLAIFALVDDQLMALASPPPLQPAGCADDEAFHIAKRREKMQESACKERSPLAGRTAARGPSLRGNTAARLRSKRTDRVCPSPLYVFMSLQC